MIRNVVEKIIDLFIVIFLFFLFTYAFLIVIDLIIVLALSVIAIGIIPAIGVLLLYVGVRFLFLPYRKEAEKEKLSRLAAPAT